MRRFWSSNRQVSQALVGVLALGFAVIFPLLTARSYLLVVAMMALYYGYMSLAWNLTYGYAGVFSFGHQVFFGLGAYTSTMLFLKAGVSPWLGMIAGGLLAALAAVVMSAIAIRYRVGGLQFTLLTLGLGEICRGLALNWEYIGGPIGLNLPLKHSPLQFQFQSRAPYFYVILLGTVILVFFSYQIRRLKFGYYLFAIREDEEAADALGVDVTKHKIVIMAISAFFVALAGTFFVQTFLYVDPHIAFGLDSVMEMLVRTLVGGAGTVAGPVIGSLFLTAVGDLLRLLPLSTQEVACLSRALYAVILMMVVLVAPGGIVGLVTRPRRLGLVKKLGIGRLLFRVREILATLSGGSRDARS